MKPLNISVGGYRDSDDEERAELTDELRGELQALDDIDVRRTPAEVPAGAKGSAYDWAQLAVDFAGALPGLVAAVRGWAAQREGASITLEIDGDRVVVEEPTSQERQALLATWVQRHGGE